MYLILCILIFNSVSAQKRTYKATKYTTKNGLSNNKILNIFTCSENYTWIATINGLHQFDGVKFNIFKNNRFYSLSIVGNHIRSVIEDNLRRIWVGTGGNGICYYDKKTSKFVSLKIPELSHISVSKLKSFKDKNGNVWFAINQYNIVSNYFFVC